MAVMNLIMWNLRLFFLVSGLIMTSGLSAGVVMLGNRVIYPMSAKSKTLQLTNDNQVPYMVQMWTDEMGKERDIKDANAPFYLSPAIFKINPHQTQMVNLIYTGGERTADTERIYSLKFIQVPALSNKLADRNKLVLNVTSTLKLFLRPDNLMDAADISLDSLQVTRERQGNKCQMIVKNNSPYYINFVSALLKYEKQTSPISDVSLLAPLSPATWLASCSMVYQKDSQLVVHYVNDYGVVVDRVIKVLNKE